MTITGADISNWRTAPYSRWAFQNVREIIPTAEVQNAPEDIWRLDASPISLAGFQLQAGDGAAIDLNGFLAAASVDALVVLHEGRIAYEFYAEETAAHAPHILMSATKAVMGLLTGILQHSGVVEVDAPVSSYLAEMANGPYAGATVRDLMDMRTGVRLEGADQLAYNAATNWEPRPAGAAPADLRAFLYGLRGMREPHGGAFAYYSANTDLLGLVLERAAGASCAELLSELIWNPLGAESSGRMTLDAKGAARSTGGLCATPRDFARIGQLILQQGSRRGKAIVPAGWIDDIAHAGDRSVWRDGEWGPLFAPISRHMSYRSGWYTIDDEPQTLFATGIYGQQLFIDRVNQLVVAKMSSHPDPVDMVSFTLTQRAFPELRRVLLGEREKPVLK